MPPQFPQVRDVMNRKEYSLGVRRGLPVGMGYFSVSFGFGALAASQGIRALDAALISVTNLTSAGQAAGVAIIAAGGSYIEMALTQLVINIRYSLMGLSLSQRLDKSFTTPHRLLASFGITDEIFAVASAQPGRVTPWYMYGLILISFLGWSGGTLLGAAAGQFLPAAITDAMGIVLYGMFLAIIIPPARKEKSVLTAVVIAALFSILFNYLLTAVSPGFAVIISAIAASAAAALLFPINEEEEEQE